MNFSDELLFFFSALGAFNGFILGLYFLLFAKPKHISNRFLGALILMISIRVGKSVIFYFNPDLASIYLQLGLSACFFIGPFLYFYVVSVYAPQSRAQSLWKYHLMALMPIILAIGILFPFESNVKLWRPYIIQFIYLVWLSYIIASAFIMRNTLKKLSAKNQSLESIEIWLLTILFGNLLIVAFYATTSFTFYLAGALAFSFLFYLLALYLFFAKKKQSVLFHDTRKYADKKIGEAEANSLTASLNKLIVEQQLYKNPNLKLPDLADKLNVLPHKLSQFLNDNLSKNFTVFINEFRITEAKELIKSNNTIKLEAVGYDCGFNSKSTFYSAFKKITGTTPAKFKESLS